MLLHITLPPYSPANPHRLVRPAVLVGMGEYTTATSTISWIFVFRRRQGPSSIWNLWISSRTTRSLYLVTAGVGIEFCSLLDSSPFFSSLTVLSRSPSDQVALRGMEAAARVQPYEIALEPRVNSSRPRHLSLHVLLLMYRADLNKYWIIHLAKQPFAVETRAPHGPVVLHTDLAQAPEPL